jgi:hypothetical protein
VAVRRSQQKERGRLLAEIETYQKTVSSLNEERAPIAAEVRKVEAEVGPIKYIAAFFYDSTDQAILEKAVTWVIMTLIIVFDPLAVILLLASQISFAEFKRREQQQDDDTQEFFDQARAVAQALDNGEYKLYEDSVANVVPETNQEQQDTNNALWNEYDKEFDNRLFKKSVDEQQARLDSGETYINEGGYEVPAYPRDDGPLTEEQIQQIKESVEGDSPIGPEVVIDPQPPTVTEPETVSSPPVPIESREESKIVRTKVFSAPQVPYTIVGEDHDPDYFEPATQTTIDKLADSLEEAKPEEPAVVLHPSGEYAEINGQMFHVRAAPTVVENYVQNEEQQQSNLWTNTVNTISQEQYLQASQEKIASSDDITPADVNDRQPPQSKT